MAASEGQPLFLRLRAWPPGQFGAVHAPKAARIHAGKIHSASGKGGSHETRGDIGHTRRTVCCTVSASAVHSGAVLVLYKRFSKP